MPFDDRNQQKQSQACLGQSRSRSLIVPFVPSFCHFVEFIWLVLEELTFDKSELFPLFWWSFCIVEWGTVYPDHDY